jgi:signal transduction histidine kinase
MKNRQATARTEIQPPPPASATLPTSRSAPSRLFSRAPGLGVTALLLGVLVAVNAVAVWGILSARRSAQMSAQKELELQTTAHARSLEALLATLRGDLGFLAQSPPLFRFLAARDDDDPMVRRWGRLDAEGTLLLFLKANEAVERIAIDGPGREPLLQAGRREGAPVLLPPETPPPEAPKLLSGAWSLGPPGERAGRLRAWVDPRHLLQIAGPGLGERLRLELGAAPPPVDSSLLVAQVPVDDESWAPPMHCWLVRREDESQLLRSVESLAGRYRITVALNLMVMTLTLVLGMLAFRGARRAARLEAENEQQARVRELERQLMHSERLASVGRLAAGMAHEINNPLEGMSNYLSLLEADVRAGRLEEAPDLVGKVRHGLHRAAGIIRQVLTFSDPGRAPKEPVEVGEALGETVRFVRSNPAYRGVAVELETPPDALRVEGNRITLGQLFLNLLLNACQARPADGGVEVRAERRDGTAVVTVRDRGPGITPEALDHLFEPFYSTRGSTGLGLAVCRGIVLDHGGEIHGRNREGGGAELEVRLPLASSSAATGEGGAS